MAVTSFGKNIGPRELSKIVQDRIRDAETTLDEIRTFYESGWGTDPYHGEMLILAFEKDLAIADVALDIMKERGYWEPMGRPGIDGRIEDLDVYTVRRNMEHTKGMRLEVEMIMKEAMKNISQHWWGEQPFKPEYKEFVKRGYETYQSGKQRRKDRSYKYD